MRRHITRSVPGPHPGLHPPSSGMTADDHGWAADLRFAVHCSVTLLGLLSAVDAAAGHLTWPRALLWTGLSALLCAVLVPPRVRAGAGWLSCQGLLRRRTVRTDRLVSVRWSDGVAQRMVLRDAEGGRVEVDPEVFLANPALWHRLDEDARGSVERGTLRCGVTALRQLSDRIDRRHARAVFTISGLE
ncbi:MULTISPECIES: hypothetical protein [unclassified Streptomyces]|uniref:hypothetical protein n=1 Tax=unclassified Streptomyces TaxID=2593676 RepID=UPI002E7705D5|nr:hypothetical protein [Streptomyces sp. JV190]MEE1840923.1 hypothetical protein [Streptomyces sp. JV190]